MKSIMNETRVVPIPMLGIIGFAIVGYLSAMGCCFKLSLLKPRHVSGSNHRSSFGSLGRFKLASFSGVALPRTCMPGSRPIPGIWSA